MGGRARRLGAKANGEALSGCKRNNRGHQRFDCPKEEIINEALLGNKSSLLCFSSSELLSAASWVAVPCTEHHQASTASADLLCHCDLPKDQTQQAALKEAGNFSFFLHRCVAVCSVSSALE